MSKRKPEFVQTEAHRQADEELMRMAEEAAPARRLMEFAKENLFYTGTTYLLKIPDGNFVPIGKESLVIQHLVKRIPVEMIPKDDDKAGQKKFAATISDVLLVIREENYMAFSGPLAGYPPGPLFEDGLRLLVTGTAKIIQPVKGPFPLIERILRAMYEDPHQPDQFEIRIAHLREIYDLVREGRRRPSPASFTVGDPGSGKSLELDLIVRPLAGGRMSNAYGYLSGAEPFNADVLSAELASMDDSAEPGDHRQRVKVGQGIKSLMFSPVVRLHQKFRGAFVCRPCITFHGTLNVEDLLIVPPLESDSSLLDKVSLFTAAASGLTSEEGGAAETADRIAAELPAFAHYLATTMHPFDFRHSRTGVIAWQHPKLMAQLRGESYEMRLYELITQVEEFKGGYTGSASEIQSVLERDQKVGHQARSLCRSSQTVGRLLGVLARQGGFGVERATLLKGYARWRLFSD